MKISSFSKNEAEFLMNIQMFQGNIPNPNIDIEASRVNGGFDKDSALTDTVFFMMQKYGHEYKIPNKEDIPNEWIYPMNQSLKVLSSHVFDKLDINIFLSGNIGGFFLHFKNGTYRMIRSIGKRIQNVLKDAKSLSTDELMVATCMVEMKEKGVVVVKNKEHFEVVVMFQDAEEFNASSSIRIEELGDIPEITDKLYKCTPAIYSIGITKETADSYARLISGTDLNKMVRLNLKLIKRIDDGKVVYLNNNNDTYSITEKPSYNEVKISDIRHVKPDIIEYGYINPNGTF